MDSIDTSALRIIYSNESGDIYWSIKEYIDKIATGENWEKKFILIYYNYT